MKKRINGKKKVSYISYFVITIFVLVIGLSLMLLNRNETKIEVYSKSLISKMNGYFIKSFYSDNKLSDSFNTTRYNALYDENKQLRKLLDIKENNNFFIAAEVTIHNPKLWYDKVYINKGSKDLITKGSVVVNEDGVIGFINKAYDSISEVSLLTGTSSNNLVSVVIETTSGNISGILTRYDLNKKMYVISDITSKDMIPPGSKVLLYGYNDNRINGILVGYVAKEETVNYGLSKRVWVKTNVDFNNLMFVSVMVKG